MARENDGDGLLLVMWRVIQCCQQANVISRPVLVPLLLLFAPLHLLSPWCFSFFSYQGCTHKIRKKKTKLYNPHHQIQKKKKFRCACAKKEKKIRSGDSPRSTFSSGSSLWSFAWRHIDSPASAPSLSLCLYLYVSFLMYTSTLLPVFPFFSLGPFFLFSHWSV
jgi:hypothetical protein